MLRERERERAVCFALIVFLLLCNYWCSVSLSHGVVGMFVLCDCDIPWSYYVRPDRFWRICADAMAHTSLHRLYVRAARA